ncbi:MAG: hypothetical protein WCN98_04555 [Verrucomicrobiaceae bacterium]
MKRRLNQRERRLLAACLLVIFTVFNVLAYREFSLRRKALDTSITQLQDQSASNHTWLKDRVSWDKRMKWLDTSMPYTDSAGRSQGQLLEELQTSSLDAELKITGQTLLEPLALDHCNEVAVNIKISGDQDKLLRWLLTLQSPEKFQAMKTFDLEIDGKSKEKSPQAQCNLTLARWFNPTPPTGEAAENKPPS